jgi:hypothetical protein
MTIHEIHEKIQAYYASATGQYSRHRSWEYCYSYFRRARATPQGIAGDRDYAALHLGFFLASWGMYRGSTFLLQNDIKHKAYRLNGNPRQPTDTLVTKIILGTFGCLPACDQYFIDGFKKERFNYSSSLNRAFVEQVLGFCQSNLPDLQEEQARIERASGFHYPLMKLVDMYFWQIGYEPGARTPPPAPASGVGA